MEGIVAEQRETLQETEHLRIAQMEKQNVTSQTSSSSPLYDWELPSSPKQNTLKLNTSVYDPTKYQIPGDSSPLRMDMMQSDANKYRSSQQHSRTEQQRFAQMPTSQRFSQGSDSQPLYPQEKIGRVSPSGLRTLLYAELAYLH